MATQMEGNVQNETKRTGEEGEEDDLVEWVPLGKRKNMERRERTTLSKKLRRNTLQEEEEELERKKRPAKSLVDEKAEMLQNPGNEVTLTPLDTMKQYEETLLSELSQYNKALKSVKEIAQDVQYTKPMHSSWRPPRYILEMTQQEIEALQEKLRIIVEGTDVPAPLMRFEDFKFPPAIMQVLQKKNIKKPSAIQMQGLPTLLSGRDMIGIAFTGSGKTLAFLLPMILTCLDQEVRIPLMGNEGPLGIVLCPSRELARQTYEICQEFTGALQASGYPELRTGLFIGGQPFKEQLEVVRSGVHMIIATPGRMLHFLNQKIMNLTNCRYFCMDEADRLVDMGFEEDLRGIFDFCSHQRQTLLFSATMPKKIQDFAKSALVNPILVNVGRAGAASLDVVQEVEYVQEESKIIYLLECLQKTPPPVLIFAEHTKDVDEIHEYLTVKGVEAVSIHGAKHQEEREDAIRLFKSNEKDVLVATDIASKGLDFSGIQHVINFDMPLKIEDYVHRIGRTGRSGKTGLATTFINNNCPESILLDLKCLLIEAKQRIPPVLEGLQTSSDTQIEVNEVKGCAFCGGLGHRIVNCVAFKEQQKKAMGVHGRPSGEGGRGYD